MEFVLILMAMKYLPPVLTAVFIAALASALMSTSDSSLLAGATMFTENMVKSFKPDISDKSQLAADTPQPARQWSDEHWPLPCSPQTIYKLAVLANTSILVGMVAPYLIGMYWKKANHIGALSSFIGGVVSWIVLAIYYYYSYVLPVGYDGDASEYLWDAFFDSTMVSAFPAFLISVVLLFVVSLLTQKIDQPKLLTDINDKPVDTKNIFAWSKSPKETEG